MPRPKFDSTDEQRRLVKNLAAVGVPHDQIARKLGVRSPKTLRKYFRDELDFGLVEANANVGASLYQQATAGNVEAQKFWLLHRGGGAWNQGALKNAQASPPPFLVACEEKIVAERVVSVDTDADSEDDLEKDKEAA